MTGTSPSNGTIHSRLQRWEIRVLLEPLAD
jgi:hypothetical protein